MEIVIYKITDTKTDMSYIGQTANLKQRVYAHMKSSRRHDFSGGYTIEVLAKCFSREDADVLEIMMIAKHGTLEPCGYNRSTGGFRGWLHTAESARRIGQAKLGTVPHNKGVPWTDEVKKKIGEAQRAARARHKELGIRRTFKFSEEGLRKRKEWGMRRRGISNAKLVGRPSPLRGTKMSEETKQKMRDAKQRARDARKGAPRESRGPQTEQTRQRMKQAAAKRSPEAQADMNRRIAETRRNLSPEVKAAAEARRVESRRRNRLAKLAAATTLPT
jgi:hypothetical protein